MNKIRFLVLSVTTAICCMPLYGASTPILTSVTGPVAINGRAAVVDSAIAVGDSVETGAMASARITLLQGEIVVGPNTRFQMENGDRSVQIRLMRGLVEITGPTAVVVGSRTLAPTTAESRFNAKDSAGRLHVEAVAGEVAIKTAVGAKILHPGEAVSMAAVPATQAPPAAAQPSSMRRNLVILGIAATAAVVTALVVHQASKCSNCVATPAAGTNGTSAAASRARGLRF